MSYRAVLSANAQADIRALPPQVAQYVLRQLNNLEANPTLLSRRLHFPFREK